MGKVYDALRRAEEQRAQRASTATAMPGLPAVPQGPEPPSEVFRGAPAASPPPPVSRTLPPVPAPARPSFWKRLFHRRAIAENAAAVNKRRIALLQPESFVSEQFRSLRARLDSIAAQQRLTTIAVTSALQGDGKTTGAVNLALVTAMSVGRKVLLIDCDLRDPAVHKALGLRVDAGLAEVLTGQAQLEQAVIGVEGANLDVLPVRSRPQNPSELLASGPMRALIEEVAGRYDRVILDMPPTLGLPDAKILSELCDGVLFVVRAEGTPREEVSAALEVLDRRRVLGLVLNGSDTDVPRYETVH